MGCWYSWEHTCLARRSREFDSLTVHQVLGCIQHLILTRNWLLKVQVLPVRPMLISSLHRSDGGEMVNAPVKKTHPVKNALIAPIGIRARRYERQGWEFESL